MTGDSPSICFICARSITLERFIRPLISGALAAGHRVEAVCGDAYELEQDWPEDVKLHIVPISQTPNPFAAWHTLRGYRRVMRDGRFDIVHAHTSVAGLLGCLAARFERVPRVLYTQHGFYFHDQQPAYKRRFWQWFESWAIRLCDRMVCISPAEREQAAQAYPRRLQEKLLLSPGPGIDTGRFVAARERRDALRREKRRELGVPQAARLVLMIARARVDKGYPELLEAFARVRKDRPDACLLMAGTGDDPNTTRFQGQARNLGLKDDTRFLGWRGDVPELLAAADVFVLPSWHEGFATSVAEALIAGVPAVGTDIPGIRFHIRDGIDGYLVPAEDADRLAQALTKALATNEELRGNVLARADELARRYDTGSVVRWHLELYGSLPAAD